MASDTMDIIDDTNNLIDNNPDNPIEETDNINAGDVASCSICHEQQINCRLPCGHGYCRGCILSLIVNNCPNCRAQFRDYYLCAEDEREAYRTDFNRSEHRVVFASNGRSRTIHLQPDISYTTTDDLIDRIVTISSAILDIMIVCNALTLQGIYAGSPVIAVLGAFLFAAYVINYMSSIMVLSYVNNNTAVANFRKVLPYIVYVNIISYVVFIYILIDYIRWPSHIHITICYITLVTLLSIMNFVYRHRSAISQLYINIHDGLQQ